MLALDCCKSNGPVDQAPTSSLVLPRTLSSLGLDDWRWERGHRWQVYLMVDGFIDRHSLNFQWLSLPADGDQDDARECVRYPSSRQSMLLWQRHVEKRPQA